MYTQQVPPPHLASLHSSVAFCCGLRACEHHVSESCDTSFIYKSHGSHHTWGNFGKEDSYFCISFVFLLMCLYLLYFCKFFCMTYMSMNVSVCLVCVNVCSDIALVSSHLVFALIENFCVWKCFLFLFFFFLWSAMSLASTGVSRSFIWLLFLWTLLLNM